MKNLKYIFLLLLCFSTSCIAADKVSPVSYKTYSPYDSTLVHVVTVDPRKVKITAARAQDIGYGLASVQDIGKHFSALIAINGGFFRLTPGTPSSGVPAGVLKIDNHWHGIAYKSRGAIGWDPARNIVLMDIIQTHTKLEINGKKLPLHAMNRVANNNKATLLSDSFVDNITLIDTTGVLLANNRVQQILTSGDFTIPRDAYAYTVGGNLQSQLAKLKTGDAYALSFQVVPQLSPANDKVWNKLPYIVGAGPLLIANKQIVTDFKREGLSADFINTHYARTAIGILPNKHWVLVVAEGGMLQDKRGLTIQELAQFMQFLGCVQAVNLDGGGSSTMYLDDSLIDKTKPGESSNVLAFGRPVSDVILVSAPR